MKTATKRTKRIGVSGGVFAIALLLCGTAQAAKRTDPVNLYVSEGASWNPEGSEYSYSKIADAVNAATVAGDVIWVKDGYVCSDELMSTSTSGAKTMIVVSKAITLRSESGYVDEKNGKGATIRGPGEKATGSTCTRTVSFSAAANLIGFVVEGGSSGNTAASYGGGCLRLSGGVVSNCVIRGGYANNGGGIYGDGNVYSTVFSNNVATSSGGGIYCTGLLNCYTCDFIENVAAGGLGGGYTMQTLKGYHPMISNCTFRANVAKVNGVYSGGGGLSTNVRDGYSEDSADIIDCRFEKNVSTYFGGAARGSNYYRNCIFTENMSSNDASSNVSGGAVFGFDGRTKEEQAVKPFFLSHKPAVLDHCTVVSNYTVFGGGGMCGGIYFCVASNGTRIAYNRSASGGAATLSLLNDCEIVGNETTNLNATSSWALYGGAGVYSCCVTNCLIANNVLLPKGSNNTAAYGGGADNCHLVGCIISNNISRTGGGGVSIGAGCVCYNNIIVDNETYGRGGGLYGPNAAAYNCLFARNKETDGGSVGGGGACGEWKNKRNEWQPLLLANCTVVSNYSLKSPGGMSIVNAINTISYGNKGGNGKNGSLCALTNCCYDAANVVESETGSVTTDPRLVASGEKKYWLRAKSPCRATGYYSSSDPACAWMTDLDDIRSTALNGVPRVTDGKTDIGVFGYAEISGLLLLVR